MRKLLAFWLLLCPVVLHAQNKVQVLWLGHAAFQITSPGGTTVLIDPWISGNPNTPAAFKNPKRYHPDAIVVTHSHADHFGDALTIAKSSGAKIVSARMTAVFPASVLPDSLQVIFNVGGAVRVGDIDISCVPAMHSSDFGGRPIGIVLRFSNGETIYHTGDTWIFGDMQFIQEFYKPSIILLVVGGGAFVQDAETAKIGIKRFFNPRVIIPMHYGEVPFNLASEQHVKTVFADDPRVVLMKPGETRSF